jgi:hypothetical protein
MELSGDRKRVLARKYRGSYIWAVAVFRTPSFRTGELRTVEARLSIGPRVVSENQQVRLRKSASS